MNGLEITHIEMFKVDGVNGLIAWVRIELNNCLNLGYMRLIELQLGKFKLEYPKHPMLKYGIHIYRPANSEFNEYLLDAVVKKYEAINDKGI